MKEYEAVLSRITHARSDVARVETIYPFAIAAIYAWVFTNPPPFSQLWSVALWLPVGIAVLGIVRLYSRRRHMTVLEEYLRELESEVYGADSDLGWERRYDRKNPLKGLIWVRATLAVAILAGTIWVAWQADDLFTSSQPTSAIR